MANEAWLNGKLEGFSPVMMPAAHALAQAITDLENSAAALTREELSARPNGAPSVAFHLRHIAGSIDRLLTYSRGGELSDDQFSRLEAENSDDSQPSAAELTREAVREIRNALDELKNVSPEALFETRFVGRRRLPTNVFGLLFHIAEHTARHVGQVVTTAKIVRGGNNYNKE
ncbi:MAG: DinB family protein [Acidobacteriota bacterium]|nr:DinB family protein [Acidobacteriota bacterium]